MLAVHVLPRGSTDKWDWHGGRAFQGTQSWQGSLGGRAAHRVGAGGAWASDGDTPPVNRKEVHAQWLQGLEVRCGLTVGPARGLAGVGAGVSQWGARRAGLEQEHDARCAGLEQGHEARRAELGQKHEARCAELGQTMGEVARGNVALRAAVGEVAASAETVSDRNRTLQE